MSHSTSIVIAEGTSSSGGGWLLAGLRETIRDLDGARPGFDQAATAATALLHLTATTAAGWPGAAAVAAAALAGLDARALDDRAPGATARRPL